MVAAPEAGGEGAYTFATEPRPVANRKKPKYREPKPVEVDDLGSANIMYDRRVIRGNTYAAQILPAAPPADTFKGTKKRKAAGNAPGTPSAVEGRRHIDVQTDSFLEELTDTVPERDITTQTDPFMDRPPTPLFIPMKIGVDAETQIETGDLFDFDFEVEPILEVLVGKTLEQGLMEVMEEEELAAMRAHQEHFEQIRNAELVATQRMEAAEKRKIEEKERRLAQERDRLEREKLVREKVAAQSFSRGYLTGLVGNVFDRLYTAGYFYDPVEKEVEQDFMPWLHKEVAVSIGKQTAARSAVESIITDALKKDAQAKSKAEELRKQQKAEVEAEKAKIEADRIAKEKAAVEATQAKIKLILYDLGLVSEEVLTATKEALTPAPEPEPEVPEGEEPPPPPPPPEPPTDEQILDKLLADGTITKEGVQEAIANLEMGDNLYTKHPNYVPPQ
mmetsp:Transcript_23853/g.28820  ORF Transcript_23853/g.28820 Transcript_23853/m.28820 type:complete len:448 (+) Transcript_23853:176-1519(+)|eukprot:CAMPEP_0197864652 /NCGR_PEP_ID=MMETSP1438-20131217/43047_1 /TAXON_ID=1461541 /ORGANISM="Pterosperma sp., Strain CCMP1384" /LENGTH=447 /DNA_ID=CAMNT_0043482979 /DNA_START=172 /DNA_END=1515 /DNA_ORIENTATION=+